MPGDTGLDATYDTAWRYRTYANMIHGESRQANEAEARVEVSAVELEEERQNGRTA